MSTRVPVAVSAQALRSQIAGAVHVPGEPEFEELRQAWNLAYTHRPALIVVPSSADDVAVAVRHAASAGQHVAVQATGHGVARTADDVMLISTKNLDHVSVDADAWTAELGAGAKWQALIAPVSAAGLAPLLGSTPDVSAVGYTLGGGMGWLARKYGLSADHVRSIEIVTADGAKKVASPESEQDLFWALRGGGAGSFGVVTKIEIDLVPVSSLYAGNLFYPGAIAREVAARYRNWLPDVPEDLTSSIVLMNFPPIDDIPEPLRGRSFTIIRGAFDGDDADGTALLDYWRAWREPEIDMWGRIPFHDIASVSNDPVEPMPALASSAWLEDLDEATVDVLVNAMFEQDGPSPLIFTEVRHAGGAVAREPEYPNAYGNRDRTLLMEIVGVVDPEMNPELGEFVRHLHEALAPHVAPGVYLNFLEGDEKRTRTREGFSDDAWARLRKIKATVDPRNMFSHGIAIS